MVIYLPQSLAKNEKPQNKKGQKKTKGDADITRDMERYTCIWLPNAPPRGIGPQDMEGEKKGHVAYWQAINFQI